MRPTGGLEDRPRLAPGLVEPVEPGIGVRLQDAGERGQVPLGMLAAAVGRVEERRCRRVGPGERPVVPDVGPQAPDLGPLLGQHRHGGVVGVQPLGREDVRPDRLDQRHQAGGRGTDPIGQRARRQARPLRGRRSRSAGSAAGAGRTSRPAPGRAGSGPARPRAIGCEGAGGWLIASQQRQLTFSRTCSTTFQRRGSHSSVSVTSSPSLRPGRRTWGRRRGPG